jgi:hypothetical protein
MISSDASPNDSAFTQRVFSILDVVNAAAADNANVFITSLILKNIIPDYADYQ